jgi:hypothetical protein
MSGAPFNAFQNVSDLVAGRFHRRHIADSWEDIQFQRLLVVL